MSATGIPENGMFRLWAGLLLLLFTVPVSAAPKAVDLLHACETFLADGLLGIEGQMCTWYVRPCECDPEKPGKPKVCLPEGLSTGELARKVVAGLKSDPALLDLEADVAAARVLVKEFPCN